VRLQPGADFVSLGAGGGDLGVLEDADCFYSHFDTPPGHIARGDKKSVTRLTSGCQGAEAENKRKITPSLPVPRRLISPGCIFCGCFSRAAAAGNMAFVNNFSRLQRRSQPDK
jgi:hypothetical protein